MLITVASFREPWEAHMFRGRLAAEGLVASIAHEYRIWNNWPIAIALGGAKVQVPRSQADAACAIERACRNGDYRDMLAERLEDEIDSFECPNCGSHDLRIRPSAQQIVLSIALLFFGAIIPAQPSGYRCKQCGTRRKIDDDSA